MKSFRHAHLQLSFNDREPIYQQIKGYIISEIQRGRLLPGVLLPGTRILAKQLKVNRNTIIIVYEQLTAQGWLTSQYKSGTRVSDTMPSGRLPEKPSFINIDFPVFAFQITHPHSKNDDEIAFDDGQPDLKLTPVAEISRESRRLMHQYSNKQLLQYNSDRGNGKLLLEINTLLNNDRGLALTPANICIMRGHQEAIYLTARTLFRQGDHVAVENPGYQPAWHAFTIHGAQLHQIPVDQEGISVEHLEALCKRQQLKALYITPHHQYPTTVTLSEERRRQLLTLSEIYHFMIIEDDYDHEYHFSKERILPVAGLQQAGNVIYIGTLCNEIPLSFVCGSAAFIHSLAACYSIVRQQESPVMELAIANLLSSGEIRKHQQYSRAVYQQKLALAVSTIQQELPSFTAPAGGLAIWLDLKMNAMPAELLHRVQSTGVTICSPYRYYDPSYNGPLGIRVGYASLEESEIVRGFEKLGKLLR
jgi:GntR family transcriptional regulator / MocR family aminotransferase